MVLTSETRLGKFSLKTASSTPGNGKRKFTSATYCKFLPLSWRTRLEGSEVLQAILANTGWLFLDRLVRKGLGLLVLVWVARYLGPVQFGSLNYALAFSALFAALGGLGLDGIVIRDLVRQPDSQGETLGSALALKIVGGLAAFGLALTAIFLVRPQDQMAHWLVGILAAQAVFQALDTIDLWFQSRVESRYTVWARNAAFGVVSLTKVILIMAQAPLVAFAWVMLGETVLGALGLALAYRLRGLSWEKWRVNFHRARTLLRESWPLIFSGLMIMLYMKIDQVMLGQMVDDEAVGIYSAAVSIAEMWNFIPMIIAASVFPALVRSKELGERGYRERIQKYYDFNACLAYILCLPMTLMAPLMIAILYGNAYKGAETILAIYIWSSIAVFLGVARGQYLVTEGLLKFSLLATVLGAGTNIAINLFLIPKYQGVGAALATVVSYFVSAFLSSFFYRPLVPIGLMQTKALLAPIRYLYRFTSLRRPPQGDN
jgi:polysaccharide transporter, PST family